MLITPVIVAALSWLCWRYYGLLDLGKQLSPPALSCHLLSYLATGEILIPVEDLVLYRPGILLGGAGDIIACMHHSPERARAGYMVAVDVRSGQPVVSRLDVSGTDNIRFQPHGIFYSRATERLYAVSHGGTSGTGTRVELFDVTQGADGLPRLQWRMAIGGDGRFANVVLNSVVEGHGDEVYVTQFQNFAVPSGGEKHASTLGERLGRAGQALLEALALGGFTGVHRCSFDSVSGTTTNCSLAAGGFVHANGLTIDDARSRLWVSDPVRRSLRVFSRGAGGELTEVLAERVTLPHAVDNVHWDAASGRLFAGSLPLLHQQLQHSRPRHGTFLEISASPSAAFDSFEDLITHDGALLSQLSACYRVTSPGGGGGGGGGGQAWGVCGSPLSDGLLVCPLQ